MLVIYGPTTTGKTDLAISLAKKFNGEIISADSRQVYEGLDIGSGKVSFKSKVEKHAGYWVVDRVKINGFDLVTPEAKFSAADFIKFASRIISQIIKKGERPILVGGTAFYIKALISGLDTIGIEPNFKLRSELEPLSAKDLYQKLLEVNQQKALSLNESDKNNPRRLIRAIEVTSSKLKISPRLKFQEGVLIIGLTAPSNFIYAKADRWTDTRFEKIVEEIKNLLKQGVNEKWLESLGLEYRWCTRYLMGDISKIDSVSKLKFDTHNFIRRQKTWFKKFKNIKLFDISDKDWKNKLEKTVDLWYTQNHTNG